MKQITVFLVVETDTGDHYYGYAPQRSFLKAFGNRDDAEAFLAEDEDDELSRYEYSIEELAVHYRPRNPN